MEALADVRAVQVACGMDHTLILSGERGSVSLKGTPLSRRLLVLECSLLLKLLSSPARLERLEASAMSGLKLAPIQMCSISECTCIPAGARIEVSTCSQPSENSGSVNRSMFDGADLIKKS